MDIFSERRINYRELQGIAKKMNLPGNLKYNLLLEIIRARKEGNEDIVDRILGEQRLERVRRKQEKLGSQESAYQHLRMTAPRGSQNVIVSREYPNRYLPQPVNVTAVTGCNPNLQMSHNNLPVSQASHYTASGSKPWAGVSNIFNTDVRTVLQMPRDIFDNYHKKVREESHENIQEIYKKNPPLTYGEWLKVMEQKRPQRSTPKCGYVQETTMSRGLSNGYHVDTEVISSPEEHKKSFQMKDILSCPQENFTPYYTSNQYDWSQLHCDIPQVVSDGFIPPNYLPSMNTWKNIYESVPDSTYAQQQYPGYNTHQDPPGSCASTSEVSPQNSDTISATDEDLPRENINEVANQMSLPLHRSYITTTQRAVQYLAQLDYEEPSTSNVPDLSSSGEGNQSLNAVSSEKEDLENSDDPSFLIIDPGEEFHETPQGDII